MNQAIIVGMSIVVLLFILIWIGLVIINRMNLEKQIEKLENITNPLPEEERLLRSLLDQRMIEQGKVNSARWVMGIFMLGLVGLIVAAPWWAPLQELFGVSRLQSFTTTAIVLLTFFCLPIMVGLSLAGGSKKNRRNAGSGKEGGEKTEGAAAS